MATYATRNDLHSVYGKENIRRWADIDGDKDEDLITQRINFALDTAEAYVNDRLRRGHYAIPFTSTIPQTIVYLTTMYAGIVLYDARGINSSPEVDGVSRHRKQVAKLCNQIVAGVLKFDKELQDKVYPSVISVDEE